MNCAECSFVLFLGNGVKDLELTDTTKSQIREKSIKGIPSKSVSIETLKTFGWR